MLVLNRIACDLVLVVVPRRPTPEVLDYYFSLIPEERRASARARLHVLEVPDPSHRSIAEKLLDRADLVDELRRADRRPARLHRAVERHRPRGGGRAGARRADQRLGAAAVAARVQERRSPPVQGGGGPGAGRAARTCAPSTTSSPPSRPCAPPRPHVAGVVIKHDDSGAGDGNQVVDLRTPGDLRATLEALPEWYLDDLADGRRRRGAHHRHAVHHPERADRRAARRRVVVLATHEQVMGGAGGQVYMGCRFPADARLRRRAGAPRARGGGAAGGARRAGSASIDFAAARDARGRWHLHALEVNLRKGGTTHPYAALRNLAPGRYDEAAGRWFTADGSHARLLGHRQPRRPGVEGRRARRR